MTSAHVALGVNRNIANAQTLAIAVRPRQVSVGDGGYWQVAWPKPTTLCRGLQMPGDVSGVRREFRTLGRRVRASPGNSGQLESFEAPSEPRGTKLALDSGCLVTNPLQASFCWGIRGYGWCGWCTPLPFKEPSGDSIL